MDTALPVFLGELDADITVGIDTPEGTDDVDFEVYTREGKVIMAVRLPERYDDFGFVTSVDWGTDRVKEVVERPDSTIIEGHTELRETFDVELDAEPVETPSWILPAARRLEDEGDQQ